MPPGSGSDKCSSVPTGTSGGAGGAIPGSGKRMHPSPTHSIKRSSVNRCPCYHWVPGAWTAAWCVGIAQCPRYFIATETTRIRIPFCHPKQTPQGRPWGQIRYGVLWGIRRGISRELIRTLGVILGATVWAWASPRITLMGLELIPWRSPDGYPRGTITDLPPGSPLGASVSHPTSAQE